jgi:signal peptidase I
MSFFRKRQARKTAKEMLRHARHFRHMREDIMVGTEIDQIKSCESAVNEALAGHDTTTVETTRDELHEWLVKNATKRPMSGVRENVEILAVAIAVAMACRTYFIQPFKIPTGSMQPTLHGIQYVSLEKAGIMNKMPLKIVKWVATGTWYKEIRAGESGQVIPDQTRQSQDMVSFYIGTSKHLYEVPRNGLIPFNSVVSKGTVFWRGMKVAGDHVFVNKVKWNFLRPKRGEIMVFNTDGIQSLPVKTHYIKRMVGLPGEVVSINPPNLMINGIPQESHETIARIGYQLVSLRTSDPRKKQLRTTLDQLELGDAQYCAFGDNTGNSRDSRYWGSVPEINLVGPAFFIYWPYSKRWGVAN